MTTSIKSPDPSYTGTSTYGETVLAFVDGVAEFEGELPVGVRQYITGAGYEIDGETVDQGPAEKVVDARDAAIPDQVGTKLRDAAVDPRPDDFLAPVNAGEADPHGPLVVSPEIHASETGPIVPGIVGEPDYQDAKESAVAEAVRVDQAPVPDVMTALEDVVAAEETDDEVDPADVDGELEEQLDELEVPEGNLDTQIEWVAAADDQDAATRRANAVFAKAPEGTDLAEISSRLQAAVYGGGSAETPTVQPTPTTETPDSVITEGTIQKVELRGEALDKALEDAELPKTGTADEKRQRLADHQAKQA